jgi:cobalt/nickel transport system permease protein
MHMADALLSPSVGVVMCAVSAAANAYTIKKIKKDDLCEKKIPIMGVMGAFVFAAQMINFTIPATGSSGHIGGGILLAAMIGGFPALLSVSAVLVIQCLFFADGGLLALGCNIFNMGVIPCMIVYPLLFKPIVNKSLTFGSITAASIIAVVVSLQFGAFFVVLETQLSGITALPFLTFLFLMQPIHLAIGIAEGIITAAVLCFVYKMRPEIMESSCNGTAIQNGVSLKNVLITLTVAVVFVSGILSIFASSYPDGLEWSIEKITGTAELKAANPIIEGAERIQDTVAIMPDYNFKDTKEPVSAGDTGSGIGTSVAGIAGVVFTFLLAAAAAFVISAVKKKRKVTAAV